MSLWRGIVVQSEVISALILRETRTRFGQFHLGYVWALIEPCFFILTFYVLYLLGKRDSPYGMDMWTFLATGVIPLLLLKSGATAISTALTSNRALLFYPQVKPLDLMIARWLLEFATYFAVFLALLGGHALYVERFEIDSALQILLGLTLTAGLSFGLGMVLCGLGQFTNTIEQIKGPLLRPLLWISGVFFAANELPDSIRELLAVNPLMHCIEITRGGCFVQYNNLVGDPWYVLSWVLFLCFAGLVLERAMRRRIEV